MPQGTDVPAQLTDSLVSHRVILIKTGSYLWVHCPSSLFLYVEGEDLRSVPDWLETISDSSPYKMHLLFSQSLCSIALSVITMNIIVATLSTSYIQDVPKDYRRELICFVWDVRRKKMWPWPLTIVHRKLNNACSYIYPWRREMATHLSILIWQIPWTEEPLEGYSLWDCKELAMTEWLSPYISKIKTLEFLKQVSFSCPTLLKYVNHSADLWS